MCLGNNAPDGSSIRAGREGLGHVDDPRFEGRSVAVRTTELSPSRQRVPDRLTKCRLLHQEPVHCAPPCGDRPQCLVRNGHDGRRRRLVRTPVTDVSGFVAVAVCVRRRQNVSPEEIGHRNGATAFGARLSVDVPVDCRLFGHSIERFWKECTEHSSPSASASH